MRQLFRQWLCWVRGGHDPITVITSLGPPGWTMKGTGEGRTVHVQGSMTVKSKYVECRRCRKPLALG